jgi:uncharacterized protein
MIERRLMAVDLRAEGEASRITGYSIVFDSHSQDLGGFIERIAPDAVVEWGDVVALFNHNPDYVLGRTTSNTLTLTRDDKGIHMDVVPPDTQWARDLMVSIARGDIKQQSFAFRVAPKGATWSELPGGMPLRTLKHISISDVSVVTTPAYQATDATVRSIADILSERPAPAMPVPGIPLSLLAKQLELASK